MRINNNTAAFTAYRNLSKNDTALSKSLERLSTGLRINRAQDDASGLAISERLRSQIGGLMQGERNAQDGQSIVAIADSVYDSMTTILQRIRDLKMIDSQGTVAGTTRTALDSEYQALHTQLVDLMSSAEFSGSSLFGSSEKLFTLQVGPGASDTLTVKLGTLTGTANGTATFGTFTLVGGTGGTLPGVSLTALDSIINYMAGERAKIGAQANALDYKVTAIQTVRETLTSVESRIRDTDVAYETTLLTRSQILVQSATAMLAQANARPLNLLALLR